jgi:hypothetical protein
VKHLLLIAAFLEIGFVLIVVPWSAYWDRNYFASALPVVHSFITNNFVRGAVSGLGLINVSAGITELVALLFARHVERVSAPSITSSSLAED